LFHGSGQLFDLVFVIWHHIFSPFPYFLFVFIRRGTGENLYFNLYSFQSYCPFLVFDDRNFKSLRRNFMMNDKFASFSVKIHSKIVRKRND
ncbi:hypothetical protein, partial [Geobacillus thermoleovorans]|uniref:hypothetical protein n=1 Tax=Geobacillus thermoleovorans TaxID=33941 RepID=UPI002E9A669D|nr:hypothetical protein [Geobacillus thermoleovorans]